MVVIRSKVSFRPDGSTGQGNYGWLFVMHVLFCFNIDSPRYQIFWEVVGLERGPLSLVSKIEELLERECKGSGLENREYSHKDESRWPCGTLLYTKIGTNFADKWRFLSRYS
jgi:hypothetical protein